MYLNEKRTSHCVIRERSHAWEVGALFNSPRHLKQKLDHYRMTYLNLTGRWTWSSSRGRTTTKPESASKNRFSWDLFSFFPIPSGRVKELNKEKKSKAYGVVSTTEQWRRNVKSFRGSDTRKTTDVETIDKNDASITIAPSGRRDECVGGIARNAQSRFC